ncbi:molecular chaperone HtpG [Blattabacterium sp. (Cryptocercus kyebangensis)]|uniref:molecular chaperone HtpG n=1 Tax=Blattabacterium sp. (Cryptocercus kyebangensis) TaxID=298656 RepID=UPI000D7C2842|nr:molecular chaperone HtpG [Blattabacterium sp. (Cryptocercus kyebangensis)]AWU43905.1 molecular chaperone HtpG [Blattabacterium sp. (Cryptocercus kyebangensis)]
MEKDKISVTSDNIFPIIKRFLYSDQEIFLRELVSNATDAILKLKTLERVKEIEIDEVMDDNLLKIKVKIDKKNKTIHIIDNGIGMTKEEVEKYINQIAFSGAEEFIQKYQDPTSSIIGHFGLGFYSSFMVAKKVIIITQSYRKDSFTVLWSCDGTPKFSMVKTKKRERGTEIVLFINEDSKEFLEYNRILKLLHKYCQFMPVPISLFSEEEKEVIINNIDPLWKKNPIYLSDKDYLSFYHELYPKQVEDALFWAHLNIDHPFHLTGVLYFPNIENKMDVQKGRIHLYKNQVYITDKLEGIVPDFLSLLKGVIDSPDIPLNVSRSHFQSNTSVKNISKYITRKVADKLHSMFKKDRKNFQKKWEHIKIIIEYGMISTKSFFDKANNFFIYLTINGEFFTLEELKEKIKNSQKNKDGKIIFLYTSDKEKQYSYIKDAEYRTYEVLILNSPLTVHLIQKLEITHKDISFVRVDSDHIDKLIDKKKEKYSSELSEKEKEDLKNIVNENLIKEYEFSVKLENLSKKDPPFLIIIPEFLRRMREITTIGRDIIKNDKEKFYQLIVNTNHLLMKKILRNPCNESKKELIQEALNLTLLSKNLLKGKNLIFFISKKIEELTQ